MPKVGVVGPISSVNRILSVTEQMNLNIEFVPFNYVETHESIDIVKKNMHNMDGWLFSGPAPKMLTQHLLADHPVVGNCFQVGASLYRGFIQMSHKMNTLNMRLSTDVTISDEINSALEELDIASDISIDDIYIKFYDHNFSYSEIIDFHYELFKAGKVDGVITSLQSVYQALKDLNVPVFRNTPTKMEIRLAVQIIEEKIHTSYFKNTQIGIAVIDVDLFNQVKNMSKSQYQMQVLELEVKRILLQLNEKLSGYIIEKGNGTYEILSSRGAVEKDLSIFENIIHQIELITDAPILIGIGFGQTFYAAEVNAYRARNHAKSTALGNIVIQDDNTLIENVGSEKVLHYEIATHDSELLKKLNTAGVSVKIYQKLISVIKRMSWDVFTVTQLSEELGVTDRNVSRIVAGLLRAELVLLAGEEAPAVRGRPRKIYRLP